MKKLPVDFEKVGAFKVGKSVIRYSFIGDKLWILGVDLARCLGVLSANHFYSRIPNQGGSVMRHVNMVFLESQAVCRYLLTHGKSISPELLWRISLLERGCFGKVGKEEKEETANFQDFVQCETGSAEN